MDVVSVMGVAFARDDTAEFARRARRYSIGESLPGLTPGEALAVRLERLVEEGGGETDLPGEERLAAAAVLDEWRQERGAPAAVGTLYYALKPD